MPAATTTDETEAALRHMAGVLLHTPMVRSRELARAGEQRAWIDGLAAVFGVTPDAAADDAATRAPARPGFDRDADAGARESREPRAPRRNVS